MTVTSPSVRGTLALVGGGRPRHDGPLRDRRIAGEGWTFKTIIQGSSVPQVFIPRLAALPAQGKFPLHKLVQHYQLAEINDAFKAEASGAVVKPVVLH